MSMGIYEGGGMSQGRGTNFPKHRIRFALEKLLNIANGDTGQGRRVANFILA